MHVEGQRTATFSHGGSHAGSHGCSHAGRAARILLLMSAFTACAPLPVSPPAMAQETSGAVDCNAAKTLCVGVGQKYTAIQRAVNAAKAGDTVWVFDGTYAGIQITESGTSAAPIVVKALGSQAVITRGGPTGDGVRFEDVSNVTVEGFTIQNPPQRCVAARGATAGAPMRNLTVRGITCSGAGLEGFYLSQVSNSLFENNLISRSGRAGQSRAHGLYLANAGSKGTTIRGNRIFNNTNPESNGIHANGDLSVGGGGIISRLVVEGNVIYGNGQSGVNLDGVQDSLFRNNLVFANARHAFRAYQIDGGQGPRGLVLVNNTFLTLPSGGWAIKLTESRGGHVAFNNILLSDSPSGGSVCLDNATGLQSSHNIVGARFSRDNEASIMTLSQWQAQGHDASSLSSSPAELFVSAETLDFRLRPGAAAIDRGAPSLSAIAAPGVDIQGQARPQGAGYDMGAYEATAP